MMIINKNEWLTSLSFFIQIRMKKEVLHIQSLTNLLEGHPNSQMDHSKREEEDAQAMIDQNLRLIDSEPHSYSLSEIIRNHVKQEYVILPQLLVGTPVSPNKRAAVRFWIYQVGQTYKMDRVLIATANYMVDMFFSGGGSVELQNLQILGLAALLLANKTFSNCVPFAIDPLLYPQITLNQLQQRICRVLKFRLNPITYVHILDELIHLWNIFAEKHSDLWKYGCSNSDNKQKYKYFSSRHIYELLDTIFLVVKSYQYSILDLCLHAFTYFLRMDYEVVSNLPKPIEDEVIINFWCNPQDVQHKLTKQPLMGSSFPLILKQFLGFVSKSCQTPPTLYDKLSANKQVQEYISIFIINLFGKNRKRTMMAIYEFGSTLQTCNSESWKVGKKFNVLKKNNRKESIETLQN